MNIFKMYKSAFLHFLILLIFTASAHSGSGAETFQAGEELVYEVSFLGIKLGSIKMQTIGTDIVNNHLAYKNICYIDTYDGIPFVSFHAVFNSWSDTSGACSLKFTSNWNDGKDYMYDEINLDYDSDKINIARWKNRKQMFNDMLTSSKRFNEGLSLFFFARRFAGSGRNIKVPTIMNRDTVNTIINFTKKIEKAEIDAIDYPVRTVYLSGKADWSGVYGITGYFYGWFSDDAAHIPIKAKMTVYIGSIDIELVSWKRKGWEPPR